MGWMTKGTIRNEVLDDQCLTADNAVANSDVHLVACDPALAGTQKWTLTHYGQVMLGDSNLCLDIKAGLKADGTREKWHEISQHNVVNVHLYTCHNPETTDRVNQLWTFAPFKNGQQVTARVAPDATAAPGAIIDAAAPSTVAPGAIIDAAAPSTAASGGAVTASMPESVDAAMAIQGDAAAALPGVVATYAVSEGALSTPSLGVMGWGLACLAAMSFLVLGIYRWNTHTPVAMDDEEAEVLGPEMNVF